MNRYLVADDYGTIVNPLLVEGQVHGAVTNGIGQALLEGVVFDPESGQTLTGSFMDYSIARADDLLDYQIEFKGYFVHNKSFRSKGVVKVVRLPPRQLL